MTVGELIEKLKQFPAELTVTVEAGVGLGVEVADATEVERGTGESKDSVVIY